MTPDFRESLRRGLVIPACPLALTAQRRLDERRQRALVRYYAAAGAGGLAVGVHTTQFAIREPAIGLFQPLLKLAQEELNHADHGRAEPLVRIGGVCGQTAQAAAEAALLRESGCHAALLSLGALKDADENGLLQHCRAVAAIIPVIGFYLQPAAGGRLLSHSFWTRFVQLENVVAIKIAPFNRYQTLDVIRAVVESGRDDLALYTGNDDNILLDLLTPFCFQNGRIARSHLEPLDSARLHSLSSIPNGGEGWGEEGLPLPKFMERTEERGDEPELASSPRPSPSSDEGEGEDKQLEALQPIGGQMVERRIVGGLLGHWSVWTKRAVELHAEARRLSLAAAPIPAELLRLAVEITDANAAFFDAANGYAGCIPGLHEILRRQGLLAGIWCLDSRETLSPGQREELDRVHRAYPHLNDDDFVAAHRDEWLNG